VGNLHSQTLTGDATMLFAWQSGPIVRARQAPPHGTSALLIVR
jgi:hypothetical protein